MKHTTRAIIGFIMLALISACGDDDKENKPTGSKLYATHAEWACSGNFCQDVYNFDFVKGSKVNFDVGNLTGGSTVQIALYPPGQVLGEINLFTNNTSEVTCIADGGCDANAAGYFIGDVVLPSSGEYLLTITRNHNFSCGSDGEYDLNITSDKNFEFKVQSADDEASFAPQEPEEICLD